MVNIELFYPNYDDQPYYEEDDNWEGNYEGTGVLSDIGSFTLEHITVNLKYYNDKKKSNPSYKYKNAMSDAKSTYKSNGGTQMKKTRNIVT
jgi:hypothetical protein